MENSYIGAVVLSAQEDGSSIGNDSHNDTLRTGARGGDRPAFHKTRLVMVLGFGGGGADADSNCPGGGGFEVDGVGGRQFEPTTGCGGTPNTSGTPILLATNTTSNAYEFGPLSYVATGIKNSQCSR